MWRCEHGDGKRHQHHGGVALGDPTHIAQAIDVGRAHRDADHHGHQGSHGNLLQPGARQQDHGQQTDAREQSRQARSTAVVDVHHRLTNQGAASHSAKEGGHDVGDALTAGFNVFIGGRIGFIVKNVLGEKAFHQAHQGNSQSGGQDHAEGFKAERHTSTASTEGNTKTGQAIRKIAQTADRGDVELEPDADGREHNNRHQLRGDDPRQPWQSINDHEPQHHQTPHHRHLAAMGQQQTRSMITSLTMATTKAKLGKLRLKDQQSQGIHKSAENPLGNKAHLIG